MKNLVKRSVNKEKSITDLQSIEVSKKEQKELKGGSTADFIGIEEVIDV